VIIFSDGRFRHGCNFFRVRPDKLPKDCLLEQVLSQGLIQDISAFIKAGLATSSTKALLPKLPWHKFGMRQFLTARHRECLR